MKITRAVVPSLFTVLNMFCGFLSIVNSSEGGFVFAAWLIILAGIFDSLDGMMARITKSSSQFGVEIDSLSDVVSFGVAPSFLVYKLYLQQYGEIGLLISSLLMIMGGIRLARFNVQLVGFDKEHFNGLPIPASAITIVTFVLTFSDPSNQLSGAAGPLLAPLVVILSLLMVSKVHYDTLPKPTAKEIKKHPAKSISFLIGIIILIIFGIDSIFYLCLAFVSFGVLREMVIWFRKKIQDQTSKTETESEEIASIDL